MKVKKPKAKIKTKYKGVELKDVRYCKFEYVKPTKSRRSNFKFGTSPGASNTFNGGV